MWRWLLEDAGSSCVLIACLPGSKLCYEKRDSMRRAICESLTLDLSEAETNSGSSHYLVSQPYYTNVFVSHRSGCQKSIGSSSVH